MTATPVLAAGALCWRYIDGKLRVLVIYRGDRADVSLPKGKVDPGETLPQTAVREIGEETGIAITLGAPLGTVEYTLPNGREKVVYYWAAEVEVQRLAAAGWIALGESKPEDALKFMRAAADLEDRSEKHIVTPARVVPARELLGEMLLEVKQPGPALAEFELSQRREPNRFRNYLGAARAAEQSGDRTKAADYYRKLVALAKDADTERPELASARAFAQR